MRAVSARLILLLLLAGIQTVQGAFSGLALCREETGQVAFEWANGGQCEGPGASAVPCVHEGESAADHCGACFDIPLPSETSLKSLTPSPDASPLLASGGFQFVLSDPSRTLPASMLASQSPLSERLRSVRLLI